MSGAGALAVLRALNLADPGQRPGLNSASAAVTDLVAAAEFVAGSLAEFGAPTRPEREEMIARLRAAIEQVRPAAGDDPPPR